jgi:CheY-like chemotaxis protein
LAVSLEKVRFLVVDDNPYMVKLVKTILRGFGAEHVFEAKSAAEASASLKNDTIDIVILDYLMDGEDGVAFVHRVRASPDSATPYVPIIMLTAHSDRKRVEAARDAGVTEFCSKPVTSADMLKKVAAVIDHPRPFIRSDSYFGPDRRRRDDPGYSGEERRKDRKA